MPISDKFSKHRYNFQEPLLPEEIELVASDADAKVIQTSEPVSLETWQQLNISLFSRRPDIEARVWGFHNKTCDLSFLSLLTNVRRLAVDCLHDTVSGIEHITSIPDLESLSVGIWQLEDFDFINSISPRLRHLALSQTRSKKPSLAPLKRFMELETIYLEGQQKDIEVLSQLQSLKDVTLRSITTDGLDYIKPLNNMWSLDIKLGGIRDLSAIRGMANIAYLELWQIKGLSDVSVIAELPGLQNLFLQSLPNVIALPSMSQSYSLRRIMLQNMKGLRDFTPLESAPSLEEFLLVEGFKNEPHDLTTVLKNPSLRRVSAGFSSLKKCQEFEMMRAEAGLESLVIRGPFEYRGMSQ